MNDTLLPHGTTIEIRTGLPVRAVDPYGHEAWRLRWTGSQLASAVLRRPQGTTAELRTDDADHPLLGRCDAIQVDGQPVALVRATDWARPASIPAVDRPGALPSGTGSAILNLLAIAARHAEIEALHYVGPYPTAALFDSLMHSFRPLDDAATALRTFTASVEALAWSGESRPNPVGFAPAPHEWHWVRPDLCVQLRDGIERIYLDGEAYAAAERGPRRIRRDGDAFVAYVELAGRPWIDRLVVDPQGRIVDGPFPLPSLGSALEGTTLPDPVRAVLREVLVSRAPAALQAAIGQVLSMRGLSFGATGTEWALATAHGIDIHAVLGERLLELDPAPMLAALVDALEPLVHRLAAHRLAALLP